MDWVQIGKRIKTLRGSSTLGEFARKVGCSPGFLSEVERAKKRPAVELLDSIASAAGRPLAWILKGEEPPPEAPAFPDLKVVSRRELDELERHEAFVPVPLVAGAAAAGDPRALTDHDIEGFCLIYESWCKRPEDYVCVRVAGDSMEPALPNGSIVAVHLKSQNPRTLNRKLVAARHEGGVTIKELQRSGEHWCLVSYNKEYPPIVIEPNEEENPIIGKVAWWWARQE
ncbi:MAG: XRE family transcriptional regulator [bacterium]|jgi:phage repressor protein C with HTH and peptisase S24 domain|nr:XRE family transcriptional regulator [bacterium]